MSKQRHGQTFSEKWPKIACVLASLHCDHRIISQVCISVKFAIWNMFEDSSYMKICKKQFGPKITQQTQTALEMYKNGIRVGFMLVHMQDEPSIWYRVSFDHGFKKRDRENSPVRIIPEYINCAQKNSTQYAMCIFDILAILSKCDFAFWGNMFDRFGKVARIDYPFAGMSFRSKVNDRVDVHFRFGIVIVDFCLDEERDRGYHFDYYYNPFKPNIQPLIDLLERLTSDKKSKEWIKEMIRLVESTRTPEINEIRQNFETTLRRGGIYIAI